MKTSACTTPIGSMSKSVKKALSNIHDNVILKYYGCGLCIPPSLQGTTVLDLGCGAGRDVYAIAQLTGETGKVIGIDMTEEQLETAREFEEYHREKFGFQKSNVEFKQGLIEKLDEVGIASESVDVIVSNCVINLVPDKEAVIREVARTLKPGGELYFSDVYRFVKSKILKKILTEFSVIKSFPNRPEKMKCSGANAFPVRYYGPS